MNERDRTIADALIGAAQSLEGQAARLRHDARLVRKGQMISSYALDFGIGRVIAASAAARSELEQLQEQQ